MYGLRLIACLGMLLISGWLLQAADPGAGSGPATGSAVKVGILPIRDDISTPMVFLVRRGVKEIIEAGADLLIIDMDTNGGRVDKTRDIIEIIGQFPGTTVTYVNRKAFSAGAYIAFGTQKIYMAPEAVIGAAAPIMVGPGGGAEAINETYEAKMNSAVAAMVRASAEKNGHNVEVADAMVRKTKELIIDGETLNQPGEILTLTSQAASRLYGTPPKPLLSLGTADSLDDLLGSLGRAGSVRVNIQPSGWEQVGAFLSSQAASMILLVLGLGGIYIEFKTPGFGIPGIVGIISIGLYFLGGYIAGLSGAGWIVLFFVGLILLGVEFFLVPGTFIAGFTGIFLMLASLLMSLVDVYPNPGSWVPRVSGWDAFVLPVRTLSVSLACGIAALFVISRIFPHTPLYRELMAPTASGMQTETARAVDRESLSGQEGVALSPLRPGGRAQFGERVCDVISRGELIERGRRVRVVGFSGVEAIVEEV